MSQTMTTQVRPTTQEVEPAFDIPVVCPECGSTARVEWRSSALSTDGRIDLVKIQCPNRHWFLMPDE
jgi:hypothetical protein